MIAYSDTSAIVPLLVEEPATEDAGVLWDRAGRLVSVRLVRVEAWAALAQAARNKRISATQLRAAEPAIEHLLHQLDLVEVDEQLVRHAALLAETRALRGSDALHLAAALAVDSDETVVVAGDRALVAAAHAEGLATALTVP